MKKASRQGHLIVIIIIIIIITIASNSVPGQRISFSCLLAGISKAQSLAAPAPTHLHLTSCLIAHSQITSSLAKSSTPPSSNSNPLHPHSLTPRPPDAPRPPSNHQSNQTLTIITPQSPPHSLPFDEFHHTTPLPSPPLPSQQHSLPNAPLIRINGGSQTTTNKSLIPPNAPSTFKSPPHLHPPSPLSSSHHTTLHHITLRPYQQTVHNRETTQQLNNRAQLPSPA